MITGQTSRPACSAVANAPIPEYSRPVSGNSGSISQEVQESRMGSLGATVRAANSAPLSTIHRGARSAWWTSSVASYCRQCISSCASRLRKTSVPWRALPPG